MKTTRDFGAVLKRKISKDPVLRQAIEKELLNSHVAALIYDAREQAGLTQQQLAERVGTRQSVIARLEDADYRGHSLTMLAKIAYALDCQLRIELEPISLKPKRKSAKAKPRRKKAS